MSVGEQTTGKWPSYSDHRHSGVEWLLDVPNHWQLRKTKWCGRLVGGGTPSKGNEDYWRGEVPWASPKDFNGDRICDTEDHISEDAVRESTTSMVPPGQPLLVVRSGILKHTIPVAINECEVALNQDLKALLCDSSVLDPRFFVMLVSGLNKTLLTLWRSRGATVESLDTERILETRLPLPPLPEQRAIVEFLDRETGRIDALIEKKRRLIELLEEKRTALITRAVTKGLDLDAALKPSGVEWLGDIPEHWEMRRLKHIAGRITVGVVVSPTQYVVNEGVPFIYGTDVKPGGICLDAVRRMSAEDSRRLPSSMLRAGDVITVRVGDPGVSAVVPSELEGANCASVVISRATPEFVSDWLCYAMNSDVGRVQVDFVEYGAAQKQFNVSHAVEFWFPVPPLEEQARIAEHLTEMSARIEQATATVREAITTLQEYRAALISEAVTGKIDVRDM